MFLGIPTPRHPDTRLPTPLESLIAVNMNLLIETGLQEFWIKLIIRIVDHSYIHITHARSNEFRNCGPVTLSRGRLHYWGLERFANRIRAQYCLGPFLALVTSQKRQDTRINERSDIAKK
jgi:hypothetical protein